MKSRIGLTVEDVIGRSSVYFAQVYDENNALPDRETPVCIITKDDEGKEIHTMLSRSDAVALYNYINDLLRDSSYYLEGARY